MIQGVLQGIPRLTNKFSLPLRLRRRIMLVIGMVNLAILVLTTVSVDAFVYRVESNAWRGRQLEAARNAAEIINAFFQRNQDALPWINQLGNEAWINRTDALKNVLDRYPAFLEIILLDQHGQILADAARSNILLGNLFTMPQSEWFRAAQAGQEYSTRVQISPQDEPYLIYAVPAQGGGVIAALIDMGVLRQVVADIHFGRDGTVFVINHVGQVNAHTDPNLVLANTSMSSSPEFQAILQAPNHVWYGERWNFNHQRVVSVSTAVGQTDWTVITELPVSEAYAASRLIRVVLPVGLFLFLSVTTWMIRFIFVRIFLGSVDTLRGGAARLAEGDLGYRMEIPRMDELGEVMFVFNVMAARLEAQRAGLEQRATELQASQQRYRLLNEQLEERVQDRTAELSKLNTDLEQLNAELAQLNTDLRSEINERRRAEKLLQASLQEKDVLLKEIYHRVKNNLQIISSLLNLQSRTVTDPHTLEVLNDSQNRVRSMALIHETLYQSDNLAQVNFRDYLQSLVPSLLRSYHHSGGAISLQLDVEDIPLPLELAIPCGLIVNELVTNTLKYAFPDERSGTLRVELHRTPEQLIRLRVADDGVGLPAGLDVYHASTLGLQLVNSLVGQLEGALEVDRQNGTAIRISFRESLSGVKSTWLQQGS